MNAYATLPQLKALLGWTADTSLDATWIELLITASRAIDDFCGRHFFIHEGQTRHYHTGETTDRAYIPDDINAITALSMDSERDYTHDGETWAAGTDYNLEPLNTYPKNLIRVHPEGSFSFLANAENYIKIVGDFGYGDGNASPWSAVTQTVTLADASATSATISAAGREAGQTLKVENEQIFIEALSSDGLTATVVRGVNGTTAAAHAAASAELLKVPEAIRRAALHLAQTHYNTHRTAGIKSAMLQSEQLVQNTAAENERQLVQMIGRYRAPWNIS